MEWLHPYVPAGQQYEPEDLLLLDTLFAEEKKQSFQREALRLREILEMEIIPRGRLRLQERLARPGRPDSVKHETRQSNWQVGKIAVAMVVSVIVGYALAHWQSGDVVPEQSSGAVVSSGSQLGNPSSASAIEDLSAATRLETETSRVPSTADSIAEPGDRLRVTYATGPYSLATPQHIRAIYQDKDATVIWVETSPGDELLILDRPVEGLVARMWPVGLMSGETLETYNAERASRGQDPLGFIEGWVKEPLIAASREAAATGSGPRQVATPGR